MTKYEARLAQVRVNRRGEWLLRVHGTDIYELLWKDHDLEHDGFPSQPLGHRLIELGWMPDQRTTPQLVGRTPVDRMMVSAMAGWRPSQTEENVWTIPVYREE